ncbi:MAG: hypothetical protein Q7R43_06190, partial [Candidatus Daviesbacteria bacterium]|nr:hypothetical protein [Candidatus Daviesbacteria bacterium]
MKAPLLGLFLIGVFVIYLTAAVLTLVMTQISINNNSSLGLLAAMATLQALLFFVGGLPSLIAGLSLRSYTKKNWYIGLAATILGIFLHLPVAIIFSIESLLIPIFIISLDIFSLYVFFSEKTIFFDEENYAKLRTEVFDSEG